VEAHYHTQLEPVDSRHTMEDEVPVPLECEKTTDRKSELTERAETEGAVEAQ